jgi:hypothetical protein
MSRNFPSYASGGYKLSEMTLSLRDHEGAWKISDPGIELESFVLYVFY